MKIAKKYYVGLRIGRAAEQYAFATEEEAVIFMGESEAQGFDTAMAKGRYVTFVDTQTIVGPQVAKPKKKGEK